MKNANFFILFILVFLTGCRNEEFTPLDHHQSFVASVNILQPSITFYDGSEELIAKWEFEKAYTGAELIGQDRIILYGHQLSEADIYQLSSGNKIDTIETGIGTTNAFYDDSVEQLFLTNSDRNSITSYNAHFVKQNVLKLRNYPMSMASNDGMLYVVNYKDTILSVIDMTSFNLVDEWTIEKSSNGLVIVPEVNELWVGGHGEGSRPNQSINVLDLQTGQLQKKIAASLMPIGFSKSQDTVYVVNHGSNELIALNTQGELLWKTEVGANPFSVKIFKNQIVVAGYDDYKIYFLKNQFIRNSVQTDRGPFQLLVREV